MAALTISAVKPSETISFSQRTRETSSGILHAGTGSHHFSLYFFLGGGLEMPAALAVGGSLLTAEQKQKIKDNIAF